MVDLHITRLVKRESGDPTFETIDDEAEVVKLAGTARAARRRRGVRRRRRPRRGARLRHAAGDRRGFDAMRDAGIPLVMRYKTTTLGSSLPERWGLPDGLRDDTGVIFASAFPGYDSFAEDLTRYYTDRGRREQLLALEASGRMRGDEPAVAEVDRRITELRHLLEVEPFTFDRRFLFRCLSMGHSQFAEIIGARGPNTQINAACASTTQALSLAEDWIRAGRCRRVVVVSADDVTTDTLLPWVASGLPRVRCSRDRRHGGGRGHPVRPAPARHDRRDGRGGFVVESAEAARERGLQPICEVLGAVTANSAFHGTRLDVEHIAQVMETVVAQAESRGVDRHEIADSTVFVSHETYTPGPRWQRFGRDQRPAPTFGPMPSRSSSPTPRASPACDGRRHRGRGGDQGPRDRHRPAGAQLQGARSRAGRAQPLAGRCLPGAARPPAGGRLRLADRHVAAALDSGPDGATGRRASSGTRTGSSTPRPGSAGWNDRRDRRCTPGGQHPAVARGDEARRPGRRQQLDRSLPRPRSGRRSLRPTPGSPDSAPRSARCRRGCAQRRSHRRAGAAESAPVEAAAPVGGRIGQVAQGCGPSSDEVAEAVVSIVAEMTGYPPDLLDLDLDLEADLGVDTVKQAEVFARSAAVRGGAG